MFQGLIMVAELAIVHVFIDHVDVVRVVVWSGDVHAIVGVTVVIAIHYEVFTMFKNAPPLRRGNDLFHYCCTFSNPDL